MEILLPNNIMKGTISGPKKTSKYIKAKINRISLNHMETVIQLSLYTEKQVFHKNYDDSNINSEIINLLEN